MALEPLLTSYSGNMWFAWMPWDCLGFSLCQTTSGWIRVHRVHRPMCHCLPPRKTDPLVRSGGVNSVTDHRYRIQSPVYRRRVAVHSMIWGWHGKLDLDLNALDLDLCGSCPSGPPIPSRCLSFFNLPLPRNRWTVQLSRRIKSVSATCCHTFLQGDGEV